MSPTRRATRATLILTCEHATHRIPRAYARLFRGAGEALRSHRGWDPGALPLGKLMARRLKRPLLAASWSRLLVEPNRSPTNPRIWSQYTRGLPREERLRILETYWRPHRQAVERAVASAASRGVVVHVGVHSFTPVLDGEVRKADIALLFDSKRMAESELARRWGALLSELSPNLRVRYNYPYRGSSDGLTTALRRAHSPAHYLGIELEANQALLATPRWRGVGRHLADSLARALALG